MDQSFKVVFRVSCPHNSHLYCKTESFSTEKEAKAHIDSFFTVNGQSKEGYGIFRGLFLVRTDKLKNLGKDLFLPTVVNIALKIENSVGKIFACLFAVAIDAITLPIRFLASPISFIYNKYEHEEPHTLVNLIGGTSDGQKAIEEGVVSIHATLVNYQIKSEEIEEGVNYKDVSKSVNKVAQQVALKKLPGGIYSERMVETFSDLYSVCDDKEWVLQSNGYSNTKHTSFMC